MNTKLTKSGPATLANAWEYSGGRGDFTNQPIVAGDRLICTSANWVFALDLYTGEEIKPRGGFPYKLGISTGKQPAPAHARGVVYFMNGNKLVALQLSDGKPPMQRVDGQLVPRWTTPDLGRPAVFVTANENVVIVCQAKPQMSATGFDPLTGARLWGPVKLAEASSGPIGTTREALLFVATGQLFAVNIRSGDTRFKFKPANDSLSFTQPPQVGSIGDKSVVVTAGTAVYGVDLQSGKQIWTKQAAVSSSNIEWFAPAISERYNRVVLANNNSDLIVLELTTGMAKWSAKVPGLHQVKIVGDNVYAEAKTQGEKLHVYSLATGESAYVVGITDAGRYGMVTANGILFVPGNDSVRAIPFGDQNGALFNGRTSMIGIGERNATPFDFGEGNFTIETWICTTRGGEIISGSPTLDGDEHHGFRVNVNDQGRVRFAVLSKDGHNSFAACSALTNVADGSWHHLAVVRRDAGVEMYVDGISVETFTANSGSAPLNITGNNALTFGAFVPDGQPQAHFSGLLREARIWDIALDAAKLQSRMQRALIGTEPHLLGYWPMDEKVISDLRNQVPRHRYLADIKDVRSFVTELALDTSVFPYLLDQVQLQWPYSGHWSARGKEEISTTPVLDRSGVLAFGAGNAIYGVHSSDGSRAWSRSTPKGASAPVSLRGSFYVATEDKGVISIDAATGADRRVPAFVGLSFAGAARLLAPVTDGRYVAVAAPDGQVWIVENTKVNEAPGEHTWKWRAPSAVQAELSMAGGQIYLVAGNELHQLDPVERKSKSFRVAGSNHVAVGDQVFCEQPAGTIVALSSANLSPRGKTFALPQGTVVTGFCASPDVDALIVATQTGDLFGLTFATLKERWKTRIPAGIADTKNILSAPVLDGRTVFCTSSSGTVAAVDATTGEFRSVFFEPTKIKTPPLVDSGELYFGCAEAPADAKLLDGALHSVVFGHTNVLRLNVDHTGARESKPGFASITTGGVLGLMGVDECCVEAWVNTQHGGEVLSICPNAQSQYGLRLWLDQDGTIHFTSVDQQVVGGAWEQVTGIASSSACDGRWHHLAVSRSGPRELTIYLDGVALSATTSLAQATDPLLSARIYIGANATTAAPNNFFAGMIAEVRVWDTYLTATRISARMHEKLIGNEPDLLTYWNFDRLSIYDGTRNGHEGELKTGGGSSGYWLADLNFTHPAYPYLETSGKITRVGTGTEGELAKTVYQLTVVARKADGTVLPNHDLKLWYVRHKGETGPDTIEASSPRGNATLKAVSSSHGDADSLTATTGSDGKVVFTLKTTQSGHGPSIDLRPAFLPPNERYHVNVLIDSQKLEKPSPPKLEAQATLIQDYHWDTGDKIDHSRDRSTWRAVITARNSDGTARLGERLQLWATEHVEVEVNGRVYPINPNNYQTFTVDDGGELTVALEADELRAPALSVWAGFMHRDERYTIPLDRQAHKDLAEIEPAELTEPRMMNWKPDYDAKTDNKAIVKEGYKPHAGKVATAIQHVMSVTQEPEPVMRAGLRAKRARLRADSRDFVDMRQAEPQLVGDYVPTLRTLKHVERQMPLEPESFKQSLTKLEGFEDSIGFVFTKDALELRPLKSVAELDTVFKMTPVESPKLLGNFLEDAWNAIEDAATTVWREAQRIAIYIADTVTLVIEYADKVVQKVVQSVKEAIDAVVHILKMIEAFIEDVIQFLRTLFDWSGILEAQKILKELVTDQMRVVRQITARGKDDFLKLLTGAFAKTGPPVDLRNHAFREMSAVTCKANDPHPEVNAQVNSVHGKYVNDKMDDRRDEIDFKLTPSVQPGETRIDQGSETQALAMMESLSNALTDPLGMSFADIYQNIKDLISGDIEKVFLGLVSAQFVNFDKLGKLFDLLEAALNAPIEIPFLSQLYKWITGNQLTLLDVSCLGLAIPTHMGYAIYTFVTTGKARRFADDARAAKKQQLTAAQFYGEAPVLSSDSAAAKIEYNPYYHWSYFVCYEIYTVGSGILKGAQIAYPQGEWKGTSYAAFVPPIISFGLTAKSLLYTAGFKEEGWNELDLAWNSTLFAATAGLDLFTMFDCFFLGDEIVTRFDRFKDKAKQMAKIGCSVVGAVLLYLRIESAVKNTSSVPALFQARDIINAATLMLTFDDTSLYLKAVGPYNAIVTVSVETVWKASAGVVHITAVSTAR